MVCSGESTLWGTSCICVFPYFPCDPKGRSPYSCVVRRFHVILFPGICWLLISIFRSKLWWWPVLVNRLSQSLLLSIKVSFELIAPVFKGESRQWCGENRIKRLERSLDSVRELCPFSFSSVHENGKDFEKVVLTDNSWSVEVANMFVFFIRQVSSFERYGFLGDCRSDAPVPFCWYRSHEYLLSRAGSSEVWTHFHVDQNQLRTRFEVCKSNVVLICAPNHDQNRQFVSITLRISW